MRLGMTRWLLLAAGAAGAAGLVTATRVPGPAASPGRVGEGEETRACGVGYVEPVTQVRRLSFKGNGVVRACRVEVGQSARAGDLLLSLQNGEEEAAVGVAEQELALARAQQGRTLRGVHDALIAEAVAEVERRREQARHDEHEYQRRGAMPRGAVSDEEFAGAQARARASAAALRAAEARRTYLRKSVLPEDREVAAAQVRLAEAKLAWRRRQLEDTRLRAPCDGRVLEVLKRPGDGIRLADNEPVLLFGDTRQLRVRAEIEERFARRLRPGQRAEVSGRGLGRESFAGEVVQVKEIMGPKTVFSQAATERKNLDVLQVFIRVPEGFTAPIGLQVDVAVQIPGKIETAP
jgi:multidrug resistance efflux pump